MLLPVFPDMKATIYCVTHYVVCKTKYRWAFYEIAVTLHQTDSAEAIWQQKLDWPQIVTEAQRWSHILKELKTPAGNLKELEVPSVMQWIV